MYTYLQKYLFFNSEFLPDLGLLIYGNIATLYSAPLHCSVVLYPKPDPRRLTPLH